MKWTIFVLILPPSFEDKRREVRLGNCCDDKPQYPFPSIDEQKFICEVLSDEDNAISLLREYILKRQEQKRGLMQVLLTGQVRVSQNVEELGLDG